MNTLYHCLGLPLGNQKEYANRRSDDFDLSERAFNCLERIGLSKGKVRDLAIYAQENFIYGIKGYGEKTTK